MFLDLLLQPQALVSHLRLQHLDLKDQWFQQQLLVMHVLYLMLAHAQVHSIHPVVLALHLLLLDALF
ncbi:hypothetical protein VFSR5_0438 [Aliivibrio fischeri SR5]|uniref:Uncharacterized protein n=1 Tax=Aliivibrio fischeri SR5 TaxID=1088719 RepID=A0AAV3EWL5_ALIFS|nr:hypothetical protein VFSR5_0438 [Aliivibrio fischeri SR5]OED56190.1 hypothetical protein BEI47_14370 [Aliivibrio fischeri]